MTVQGGGGGGGGGGRGGGGGEAAALGIREQAIEKYLALIKDKRDLQRKNQKVAKLASSSVRRSFEIFQNLAILQIRFKRGSRSTFANTRLS